MPSRATQEFQGRLTGEIQVLQDIVRELTGAGRGRRETRMQVLHGSALVLLTAAFERYVEKVAEETSTFLSSQAKGPSQLPPELRKSIASQKHLSRKNLHDLFAWDFAEDGWREKVLAYTQAHVSQLNTPNSINVRDLFCTTLAIEDITSSWNRRRMTAKRACEVLDDLLDRRHTIAHGAESAATVLADVEYYKGFLSVTIERTDRALGQHLSGLVGTAPW